MADAVEDIEDLLLEDYKSGSQDESSDEDAGEEERLSVRDIAVMPRRRAGSPLEEPAPEKSAVGLVPGAGSIFVKTWGCAHNNSDGEYMAGLLQAEGYQLVNDPDQADLWVLNSCTVKGPSELSLLNQVQKGQDKGVRLIVTGCVPQGQPTHGRLAEVSLVGVSQIDRIAEVAQAALQGQTVRLMAQKRRSPGAPLDLPKVRQNSLIEIVPINSGCLNQCTYCKTKAARGDLRSYPVQEVVARIEQVQREGVAEIWLTSEDTGAYGRDIGTSLPELLRAIVAALRPGVRLRLGMTNPPYIREHLPAIAEILRHPQVYRFLHIPVQAASDVVLDNMRRKYTCAEFREVCDFLLEHVPGITLATDIICGFPGETPEQWEETMELVRQYKFPILNISQFYPRPGTPAARMKRVPTHEVKARSRQMTQLFESYRTRDHHVGQVQEVLATQMAKDGVHFAAHNLSYDQILVPADPRLLGKLFKVRITEAQKHFMRGELIPGSEREVGMGAEDPQPAEGGAPAGCQPGGGGCGDQGCGDQGCSEGATAAACGQGGASDGCCGSSVDGCCAAPGSPNGSGPPPPPQPRDSCSSGSERFFGFYCWNGDEFAEAFGEHPR